MIRPHHSVFLSLCLATGLTACTDDDASPAPVTYIEDGTDPELVRHLRDAFGTRIFAIDGLTEFVVDEAGDAVTSGEFSIEIEALGEKRLYMEEIVSAASKGGGVLIHLEDTASGESRFFDYDIAENYVAFGQDLLDPSEEGFKERGAAVSRLEDGRYTVWTFDDNALREDEQIVEDGFAALRLVEQYSEFNAIGPHIMMAAIALGHTAVPEARVVTFAHDSDIAARPPLCSLFTEFCDCAACNVLDRGGDDCGRCPDL